MLMYKKNYNCKDSNAPSLIYRFKSVAVENATASLKSFGKPILKYGREGSQ